MKDKVRILNLEDNARDSEPLSSSSSPQPSSQSAWHAQQRSQGCFSEHFPQQSLQTV